MAPPAPRPGECVCQGTASDAAGIFPWGVSRQGLATGDPCLEADFDGNGVADFLLTGGEGNYMMIRRGAEGALDVVRVDAAGMAQLYLPRDTEGPSGEPVSETYGIFVPNVGQSNAVFLWDGAEMPRTLLPTTSGSGS